MNDSLLSRAVSRARALMVQAQPGTQVALGSWVSLIDLESLQCYERAGFQEIRRNWRREIELGGLPASPIRPKGVELRPLVPERDARAVFEVVEGAFQEDWEYTPEEFAEWRSWTIERAEFDPSLSCIAWAGDQPVGGALCHAGPPGWVNTLAVARARFEAEGLAWLFCHTPLVNCIVVICIESVWLLILKIPPAQPDSISERACGKRANISTCEKN